MAISLVGSIIKVQTAITDTTALAYSPNPTTGNCLVACQCQYDGGGPTINTPTDSVGHTYLAAINQHNNGAADTGLRGYYVLNITGGANSLTGHSGSGTSDITIVGAEFGGIASANALDQTGTGAATGTAVSSATGSATTRAYEVVIGLMTYDSGAGNVTITEGQTIIQEDEDAAATAAIGVEYQVVTTAGVKTSSWTLGASRAWIADNFTLKGAGGGMLAALGVG